MFFISFSILKGLELKIGLKIKLNLVLKQIYRVKFLPKVPPSIYQTLHAQ